MRRLLVPVLSLASLAGGIIMVNDPATADEVAPIGPARSIPEPVTHPATRELENYKLEPNLRFEPDYRWRPPTYIPQFGPSYQSCYDDCSPYGPELVEPSEDTSPASPWDWPTVDDPNAPWNQNNTPVYDTPVEASQPVDVPVAQGGGEGGDSGGDG
jgi:hypothetical protein